MPDLIVAACGIQFPEQGSNLGLSHWEYRVLATGPPGKSCGFAFCGLGSLISANQLIENQCFEVLFCFLNQSVCMKIVSTQDRPEVLNPNKSLSNTCHNCPCLPKVLGLPRWLSGRESTCNAGDPGSISPGEGNGNPLQYSCLENPMNREAWQATVHRVAKSWTWLRD